MKSTEQLQDETISNIISMLETIANNYTPEDTFTNADIRALRAKPFDGTINREKMNTAQLAMAYVNSREMLLDSLYNAPKDTVENIKKRFPAIDDCIRFNIIESNQSIEAVVINHDDNNTFKLTIPFDFFKTSRYPRSYNPTYLKKTVDLSEMFNVTTQSLTIKKEGWCWCVLVKDRMIPEDEATDYQLERYEHFYANVMRTIEVEQYVYSYNALPLERLIIDLENVLKQREEERRQIDYCIEEVKRLLDTCQVDHKKFSNAFRNAIK